MAIRRIGYYRYIRKHVIKKRKRLDHRIHLFHWYKVDGKYSKGKIHCSCNLCRPKHIPTTKQLREEELLKYNLKEYRDREYIHITTDDVDV